MTFSEILIAGLDNPECSFFVGMFIGQILAVRIFLIFIFALILFSIINKLALAPFLEWARKRIYRSKKKDGKKRH